MSFEQIVGNENVKEFLNNQIVNNHLVHSYMFCGIDGIGKILFAKEFARKILCENKEDDENCISCIKFKSQNHPDFMIVEEDTGTIKIEQIRKMQEEISQKPITSSKKVYIIRDCDLMTKEAQNCLLKTLEEPPEYVVIILTTANEEKMLNTIKSRCMKISFLAIEDNQIEEELEKILEQKPDVKFVKAAGGSIGKAIYMQQEKEIFEKVNELLENIDKKDLITILNLSEILYKEKDKIEPILEYMINFLYASQDIRKISSIKYVEETKRRIIANSNYDMCIDYLLMNLWEEINEKYNRSAF